MGRRTMAQLHTVSTSSAKLTALLLTQHTESSKPKEYKRIKCGCLDQQLCASAGNSSENEATSEASAARHGRKDNRNRGGCVETLMHTAYSDCRHYENNRSQQTSLFAPTPGGPGSADTNCNCCDHACCRPKLVHQQCIGKPSGKK